jgi:alpha-N-acetylglucosaminidase
MNWVRSDARSADPDALGAWRLLRSSAYATWGGTASMQEEELNEKLSDFKVYACTDSVFAATPSRTADQASAVGPHRLHYDPAQVEAAWLRDARRWGADEAQSRQLERAAKRLVTVWGGPDSAILTEYANRIGVTEHPIKR